MSSDLTHQIPILMLVVFLAAVVQGSVGFGFGLFAVAALSMLVALKSATPLLALVNLPVTIYLFWRLRRAVVWSGLAPIIVGMVAGVPFGVYVLVAWPEDVLLRVLGVVLIASAIRAARPNGEAAEGTTNAQPGRCGQMPGLVVGLTTGALGGAFNTGGPPIIAYVYCRPGTKEQRTAALQAVFTLSVAFRIIVMAAPPASLYGAPIVLAAAACLPAALVGSVLGHRIFRRFPPRALEVCVSIFLAAIGLKLLVWP